MLNEENNNFGIINLDVKCPYCGYEFKLKRIDKKKKYITCPDCHLRFDVDKDK